MTAAPDARVTTLQTRIAAIDASLSELDQKYNECASRFDGDPAALMKEAGIISTRIDTLKNDKCLLLAAGPQLELKHKAEEGEQEQQEKRKQLLAAREIADQIMALQVDLDRMLVNLREAFERRAVLLRALANTEAVDLGFANRFMAKGPITAAAQAAGLHRFIDIVTVATASVRALATSNSILVAVGRGVEEPARAVPPRRSLRSNGGET
jgi:hypothetical protein